MERDQASASSDHVVGDIHDPGDAVVTHRPKQSLRCITSEQLFAGATEVQVKHRGALYRLKQTSLGKLILTK